MNNQTFIILIPGFPVDENDTTCLPAQQLLIRKINELFPSLEIVIIAFQYPFTNKEYYWFSNKVIPFNSKVKNPFSRILSWIKIWKKLSRLKKENDIIGIFSCWCTDCALVGKYFSLINKLKHYIWICGQDARESNKLVKIIKPAAQSLIAISKAVQYEFFKNHHIFPKHIIENGIDVEAYNNTIKKTIDVIGVGSLIPLKRFEILVEIVSKLKQVKPAIQALIIGKGKEKDKLELLIKHLQLENNIQLIGEVNHLDVLKYMQRSKILLHPSSYEGFSGVCIEALYAGTHVISFCNPVETKINHWHIVESMQTMFETAKEILNDETIDFTPVLYNDMKSSVKKLMELYNLRAQ